MARKHEREAERRVAEGTPRMCTKGWPDLAGVPAQTLRETIGEDMRHHLEWEAMQRRKNGGKDDDENEIGDLA